MDARVVSLNKQRAFAWAKYYEEVRLHLHDAHDHYNNYNRVADDRSIPEHIKNEMKEMAKALKKKWECPICLDFIEDEQLDITNCGHYYCKDCLKGWKDAEKARGEAKWKCGVCNRKHNFGTE
jgi:late competence protein required for DNA uptake (superfamily II DNA/RNA helicase)